MLASAEMVDAYRFRHLQVTAASDVDMHQSAVAAPIFGRCMVCITFGRRPWEAFRRQQSRGVACLGVGLRDVAKEIGYSGSGWPGWMAGQTDG